MDQDPSGIPAIRVRKEILVSSGIVDQGTRPSVLYNVTSYILVNEFCERLAYYGFAGSLVLFFQTKMGMSNAEADIKYAAWNGTCYVTPLLGGFIADSYLGRSKTILVFSIIYFIGLAMVVVGSRPDFSIPLLVFFAIYIIAIGTGGIKPNVSTLGADQFDERYERDRKEKASFFNWFYWSVNLGAIISYTAITYVCQNGIVGLGGPDWGFFIGYMIPCISMAIAILIFLFGYKKYKKLQPQGSLLMTVFGVLYESVASFVIDVNERNSRKLIFLDRAASFNGGSYDEKDVTRVKMLVRIVPFMLMLIPFWGIYSQTSTAFQNQACQMDLRMGSGVSIPPAALNVFDSLAVLLLVPVFDRYLYPAVTLCRGPNKPLTMLQKMGWGFFFALVSMAVAALVEEYRLARRPQQGWYDDSTARDNISPCHNIDNYNPYIFQKWEAGVGDYDEPSNCHTNSDCDAIPTHYYDNSTGALLLNLTCVSCDDIPQMSGLSVFWQLPQFALIGTAEILAAVTALEFFYSEAPSSMKSVTQSLNLFMNALGTWGTIPIVIVVNTAPSKPWLPENLDDGKLTYYFLLLGTIMTLNMVIFFWVSSHYTYVNKSALSEFDARTQPLERKNSSSSDGSVADDSGFFERYVAYCLSFIGLNNNEREYKTVSKDINEAFSDDVEIHLNDGIEMSDYDANGSRSNLITGSILHPSNVRVSPKETTTDRHQYKRCDDDLGFDDSDSNSATSFLTDHVVQSALHSDNNILQPHKGEFLSNDESVYNSFNTNRLIETNGYENN